MCPSLAEPDSDGIPKTSRKQKQGWNPLLPDAENPFSLKAVFALFPCEILLLGKPTAYGSAKSLCSLPLCCSLVVALSELSMNLY